MRSFRALLFPLTLLAVALAIPACDTSDASSVKVTLHADLSGELLTSAMAVPAQPDASQASVGGITWRSRGAITMAQGGFTDINTLNIGGITFKAEGATGEPILRVRIPRGPGAKWPSAFTVASGEARKAASKALDPTAKASTIGEMFKLEVSVPGVVISAGSDSKLRGVNSSFEETRATIAIPVDIATTEGEPLTWHITWRTQNVK